jgi:hypothetical protein
MKKHTFKSCIQLYSELSAKYKRRLQAKTRIETHKQKKSDIFFACRIVQYTKSKNLQRMQNIWTQAIGKNTCRSKI